MYNKKVNNFIKRGFITAKEDLASHECIMCKELFDYTDNMHILEDQDNKKLYLQCPDCAKISNSRQILIIKK